MKQKLKVWFNLFLISIYKNLIFCLKFNWGWQNISLAKTICHDIFFALSLATKLFYLQLWFFLQITNISNTLKLTENVKNHNLYKKYDINNINNLFSCNQKNVEWSSSSYWCIVFRIVFENRFQDRFQDRFETFKVFWRL